MVNEMAEDSESSDFEIPTTPDVEIAGPSKRSTTRNISLPQRFCDSSSSSSSDKDCECKECGGDAGEPWITLDAINVAYGSIKAVPIPLKMNVICVAELIKTRLGVCCNVVNSFHVYF